MATIAASSRSGTDGPLMAGGAYGPYIYWGRHNRLFNSHMAFQPRCCYSLWIIQDGTASLRLGRKMRRLELPAAVLLEPMADAALEIPAASNWRTVHFAVIHQPLRRASKSRTFVPIDDRPQPAARAVWGVDLPAIVPAELVQSCIGMMWFVNASWWRDDLNYARSNARLGNWLIEYVTFVSQQHGLADGDWLARCEHLARQQSSTGVSVTDLARVAGMSRQGFTRHFTAARGVSPGEFLRQVRMEQAMHLLRSSDHSIGGVARICGYRSPATFCHRFRAHTGQTPGAGRPAQRL